VSVVAEVPPSDPPQSIELELQRGTVHVRVRWPMSGATACAALAARDVALIRVDALWLAVEPLDMRAGTEAALRRVVAVFGAARPNHASLFANRRANRMKVLVQARGV
jgi:hypothetical protein